MKLCLILDRLRSAHNTGNIFRIAEALGAEIVACGYTPAPPHPKLAKTAMGTDLTVPCRTMPDAASAIRMLRSEGYRMILAAEPGPESVFAWEKNYEFPLAVVFGTTALLSESIWVTVSPMTHQGLLSRMVITSASGAASAPGIRDTIKANTASRDNKRLFTKHTSSHFISLAEITYIVLRSIIISSIFHAK